MQSPASRLAAVGTIGHAMAGGRVIFWGTGSSPYLDPFAGRSMRKPYARPRDTTIDVRATRGPISHRLLGDIARPPVYGDPVWLLERFYRPSVTKHWDVGVIIHLADLADRAFEAHPKPQMLRYRTDTPDGLSIRLLNTVTQRSAAALRARVDDIMACRRIVSTSLHGLVIAEAYGIPCMYFAPRGPRRGLCKLDLETEPDLDIRIVDLYRGFGKRFLPVYVQPRGAKTSWRDVARAVDEAWEPLAFDPEPIVERFPLELNPLRPLPNGTVFDHPLVTGIPF
jgi:hypothetical protein